MSEHQEPEHLIREWQAGGRREEIFHLLYERYSHAVGYFFRKRGFSREDCLDLCQDTFVRVYQGMKKFRLEASFETWLFRIARNVWRNALRHRSAAKREGEEVPLEDTEPESKTGEDIGPLDAVLVDERLRLVRDAMTELPPQQQRIIIMIITQDLQYREIAALLDIPVGTVKSQLSKARKRLRQILGSRYADIDLLEEHKEAS